MKMNQTIACRVSYSRTFRNGTGYEWRDIRISKGPISKKQKGEVALARRGMKKMVNQNTIQSFEESRHDEQRKKY
jgi:hypothetical protein